VSITFQPEPDARSRAVIDYRLKCVVEPRRDQRSFATYEADVAGLADHAQYCADAGCFPATPYIASRRPWDDEPAMNVSTVNGALLLRALGLVPELGAAAVLDEPDLPALLPGHDSSDLTGTCEASDFLGRIDLALALSPADEGRPWHPVTPGSNFTDCGRRGGYLHDRLHELREIAVFAHTHQRHMAWF
jgi:hypothetical protein